MTSRNIFVFVMVAALAAGCGTVSARDVAQRIVVSGGVAQQASEVALAAEYLRVGGLAIEEAESREEALLALAPWENVRLALSTSRRSLTALQAAVDAWQAADVEQWTTLAEELLHAVMEIAQIMHDLDVPVPEAIDDFLTLSLSLIETDRE